MPNFKRIPYHKLPLPVYKPSRTSWLHKIPRDEYLRNPAIKYPIYNRLPKFWRDEFEQKDPIVHQTVEEGTKRPYSSGLWKKDEEGRPVRVETVPLRIHYPKEAEEGLWGGETIVTGWKYPRGDKMTKRINRYWKPMILTKTLYSEILDRTIETTVTPLALDQIDEAYGFDFYILKTPNNILRKFGSSLKREMLLTLAFKDEKLYPSDKHKQDEIFNKYKGYVMDAERASWVGLTLVEAMHKQYEKEQAEGRNKPIPLLEVYTKQLREQIEAENRASEAAPAITIHNVSPPR